MRRRDIATAPQLRLSRSCYKGVVVGVVWASDSVRHVGTRTEVHDKLSHADYRALDLKILSVKPGMVLRTQSSKRQLEMLEREEA